MIHVVVGDSPWERDLRPALRRDMDHALDSDTEPRGPVLC